MKGRAISPGSGTVCQLVPLCYWKSKLNLPQTQFWDLWTSKAMLPCDFWDSSKAHLHACNPFCYMFLYPWKSNLSSPRACTHIWVRSTFCEYGWLTKLGEFVRPIMVHNLLLSLYLQPLFLAPPSLFFPLSLKSKKKHCFPYLVCSNLLTLFL